MNYTSKSARILQEGMARMRARRQKEGLPPALEFTEWATKAGPYQTPHHHRPGEPTMPRFIIVSCASGYALNIVEADSPVDACRASDDSGEFTYETIDVGEARCDDTLIVYGPTDLPVDDCTDPAVIAAIDALPIAGYVRCSPVPR